MFFPVCNQLHVFPRLALVTCLPALINVYMFSRDNHKLHVCPCIVISRQQNIPRCITHAQSHCTAQSLNLFLSNVLVAISVVISIIREYSQFTLNGRLYKADISIKRTPAWCWSLRAVFSHFTASRLAISRAPL